MLLLIMGLAFSVLGGVLICFPRDPHGNLDRLGLAYLGIAAMLMVVRFLVGIRHEWRARRSRVIRGKLRAAEAQRTGAERILA